MVKIKFIRLTEIQIKFILNYEREFDYDYIFSDLQLLGRFKSKDLL